MAKRLMLHDPASCLLSYRAYKLSSTEDNCCMFYCNKMFTHAIEALILFPCPSMPFCRTIKQTAMYINYTAIFVLKKHCKHHFQ